MIAKTLTVEQAAQALGCSRARVFQLLREGEIKSFRVARRQMIPASELDALIERRIGDQSINSEASKNRSGRLRRG